MIYITSDLHLCHNKTWIYYERGFQSVEEMNETIVNNWNSMITNEDDVYILGDLMLEDNDRGMELLRSLNGKLHIILGNHDTPARQELYKELSNVVEMCYATVLKYKHYNFYLSHYPTLCANFDTDKPLKARVINLCGHTHTKDRFADMDKGLIYHCEMDAHNCNPILLDIIIQDLKSLLSLKELCNSSRKELYNRSRCCKCAHGIACHGFGIGDFNGTCPNYVKDPPDGGFYG